MAPEPGTRRLRSARRIPAAAFAAAAATCLLAALPAHALRIVNHNLLNYPSVNVSGRNPHFRTVHQPLGADVVVVQEMQTQAGVDSFRINVLNVLEPGQWASAPFLNGNDTDNAIFYKPAKVDFLGQRAFYVSVDLTRYVNEYRLRPVGYASSATELRLYSVHLKASNTGADAAQRLREATGLRDTMNAAPAGTHMIALGDFNIYSGAEAAFGKFLESQIDNDGRLYDPLSAPLITWNTSGLAAIHTQSPCATCPSGSYASGGLDDRFDMFLPTYNLNDAEGLDLLVATYKPVGNDGLHYNLNINDSPTIPEGAAYATALWNASDHLPIRVDLQLPAKISTPGALAFGTVIVGGPAAQNLSVTNPATVPADELNYSLAAPAGFSAPGGSFALNAGAPAALHAITMNTATAGTPAGNLSIASDDPDQPARLVAVSGTVLDHAAASLDSLTTQLGDTLDFGDHQAGEFPTLLARAHNLGHDALQARLLVSAAAITGGDSRFSIVGGFSPALVAGVAVGYPLAFDDTGSTADSTYLATLTFTTADEPLPGAVPQDDLILTLRARRTGGTLAVGDRFVPGETRLFAPFPNPLTRAATVRFDLARAAHVRIEVFDLHGRRVAGLADRAFDPGRHDLRWNGRADGGGALGAGLYFVRMSGAGLAVQSARFAIVR